MVYPWRNGFRVEHGTSVFDASVGGVPDSGLELEDTLSHSARIVSNSWGIPWWRSRMVAGVLEPLSVARLVPKSHTVY